MLRCGPATAKSSSAVPTRHMTSALVVEGGWSPLAHCRDRVRLPLRSGTTAHDRPAPADDRHVAASGRRRRQRRRGPAPRTSSGHRSACQQHVVAVRVVLPGTHISGPTRSFISPRCLPECRDDRHLGGHRVPIPIVLCGGPRLSSIRLQRDRILPCGRRARAARSRRNLRDYHGENCCISTLRMAARIGMDITPMPAETDRGARAALG
jgi:hypothetical protein